jgi:hypothetical protein
LDAAKFDQGVTYQIAREQDLMQIVNGWCRTWITRP